MPKIPPAFKPTCGPVQATRRREAGGAFFVGETRGQGHEALVVRREDVSAGHIGGKGHEVLIRRPRVGRGRENRVEGMRRQRTAQRHAGRERLHRLEVTIHLADRADGGWRGSILAGREQRVGRQQRAVSVGDLVRFRIEHVENVELELQAIVPAIAAAHIEPSRRRRLEVAVLGQGIDALEAKFQRAEPARLLADFDHHLGDNRRPLGNVIAGRVAEEGEISDRPRLNELRPFRELGHVEAARARMAQSEIAVEMQPIIGRIVIGEFDAIAPARSPEQRRAGVAVELAFRVEIQPPEGERGVEPLDELGARADFRAARFHQQRNLRRLRCRRAGSDW